MFGIAHLGLSLDAINSMTWKEFVMRSIAYKKSEEKRIEEYQYLIYNINISAHLNPEKLPKSFNAFKKASKGIEVNKTANDFFIKEMAKYNEIQKNGKSETTG